MTAELVAKAQAGDGEAFGRLVEPYRRELRVHCYRILGSAQDAEDALQETLLSAWQGLGGFEGRASVRTWLYRVATNRCLNALRSGRHRPRTRPARLLIDPPEPTRLGEVTWLEPYPDALLDGLADPVPGPEARYEAREAISLAFVTALQVLPPRQRAVLVLRDVLGFRAAEAAGMLGTTEEGVTSALKRARATLQRRMPPASGAQAPPRPGSPAGRDLVDRLARAYESGDVDGVVALLTDDVWVTMPPAPQQYQGRAPAARFLSAVAFRGGRTYRLVQVGANGQPAFGAYVTDPQTGFGHASGLLVLTMAGLRVSAITRFDNSVLPAFGLPCTLR